MAILANKDDDRADIILSTIGIGCLYQLRAGRLRVRRVIERAFDLRVAHHLP